jgi:hypothetical protein
MPTLQKIKFGNPSTNIYIYCHLIIWINPRYRLQNSIRREFFHKHILSWYKNYTWWTSFWMQTVWSWEITHHVHASHKEESSSISISLVDIEIILDVALF